MKKIAVLFFSLSFHSTISFAAIGTRFLLKPAIHQGWRTMGELSTGIMHGNKWGGYLATAGTEFNFQRNRFILGPKATCDFWLSGMVAGASFTYYTDFDKGTLYFNPHLGSIIYFGWNIPLMRNHMKDRVNTYTFTLIIPIPIGNDLSMRKYYKKWHLEEKERTKLHNKQTSIQSQVE